MDSVITQVPQSNNVDSSPSHAHAHQEQRLQDENADPNANSVAHANANASAATSSSSQMFTVQKNSKKKSNFLCSIICCLGKRGSRRRRKDKDAQGGGTGSGAAGSRGSSSHGSGDAADASGGSAGGPPPKSGMGGGASSSAAAGAKPLLGELRSDDAGKKCIVIDLDETLVHSSFKPISNADFIVPVEIDGTIHQVYVLKRPHVDEFLCKVGELFECVLFTASLAKYADPVTDLLDKWDVFHSRLFRESCVFHRGNYVKDLSRLGREIHKIIIVDNSPASYIFHPDNAVPVASWFDDMNDRELLDMIPFLENVSKADNVYGVLQSKNGYGSSVGGRNGSNSDVIRNN